MVLMQIFVSLCRGGAESNVAFILPEFVRLRMVT